MKQGWEIKKLGEVCDIINGRNQKLVECTDGKYPIYGSGGIMGYASQFLCKEGTTIIGRKGTINKPIYVEEPFWNVDTAFGLQPKDTLNSKLLHYFCLHFDFLKLNKGTTIPSLVKADLLQIDIPYIPSLAEQERIVEILDREFEKIDALKENAEKNLQHAKDLFQSALKQELQPKEGWATKTISEISENLDYRRVPVTKKDSSVGVYPYYGASGIVDYVDGFLFDENLLLVSEDGANLLARSTPIAFSVSGKIWVNNHAHILRFPNIELQRYVEYFFAGLDISEYVTGAAQPKFNQKALNSILISYPPKVLEQQELVEHLDKLEENCRTLEENYTKTIALCDDMKQALLRKAFNGEL